MAITMQEQAATEAISAPPGGRPAAGPPIELELGDGSRLVLEDATASPIFRRIDGADTGKICLDDVMSRSGEPFAGYRRLK